MKPKVKKKKKVRFYNLVPRALPLEVGKRWEGGWRF